MSKLIGLTTLIIVITLTVNLHLIPQVNSTPEESSTPSPLKDSVDDYESNGPVEMNKGDLINKLDENEVYNTRDLLLSNNVISQASEEQGLTGDDEDATGEGEPPISTERGGNPLEGLNLAKSKLMAQCLALKQETKGTEIEDPFGEEKTLEEKCKEVGI